MTELSFINKPQSQPIKYKSIIDVFNENASEFPEKEICIQRFPDGSRRPITYSDLKRKAMRTASYLVGQGIKVGDKVGIAGPNSIEWIIGELAILMAGAVSVHLPMFEGNFRKTLEGIQISECKSVLLDPENDVKFVKDIEEYVSNNPSNERSGSDNLVFVLLRKIGKSFLPDLESMEISDEPHTERKLPRIFPETTAIIFMTSGSTGKPKMVECTHLALVNTGSAYMFTRGVGEKGESFFNDRPFSWMGGSIIYCLLQADTRVFRDGRITAKGGDIMDLWNIIMEEKCTSGLFLPFTIYDMLQNKDKIAKTGYRMKSVITGGQIIKRKETGILGEVCESLYMLYGSTEVGIVTYCQIDGRMETGRLGSVFPGVQIKVVGEDLNTVVRGEMGTLYIKSPWMLKGYFNATEDQNKSIVDGWMNTGDVGILRTDGQLIIKGKMNNIIKRGTLKVLSGEVEECIATIAGVKDAVVIAVPDPRLYEEVCACVVLDKHASVTIQDVRTRCAENLGDNVVGQAPTFYLEFDTLPQLGTGKPDKVKIKQDAMSRLGINTQ
ncbi:3-[(3aS,4S,7aS)-7a-methyl-1,5-dioxo-octahydro-1H-inden-4-yl]propanoyl:CoA ligase-like [Pecten maximus]|uniref:3-[(3aS,4S,7aS)-7a-methyl-1, 5-dioxo-octahydro-1H-inden-4-yl]propanoyl:CoA ligase-like n=1 Tax=Pecten maximus TaxID=6579 RepID=UPI001458E27C|nr:3-[(3aS,4S,7aS)-7a-methyl-1,5-dioxo-octahydro-1H-inden-4-yl]propanoyl:CoA ligase-like [Pecten maximus]